MTISAIILTKNEEKNIIDCLSSLSFCDEIIVIDDRSNDQTCKLARQKNVRIIPHALDDDFAAQRNFALTQAKGEWVLFVDADERVGPGLADEIKRRINDKKTMGYFIKRVDYMRGKPLTHGETGNTFFLRLAQKNAGKWIGKVHEKWEIKYKCSRLDEPLLHYPHPTVAQFLSEINYYTSLRAKELYDKKIKVSVWQILFYPIAKFSLNYFFKLGFLDGTRGMISAIFMSFHSFLVRGKLWQLQQAETKNKIYQKYHGQNY